MSVSSHGTVICDLGQKMAAWHFGMHKTVAAPSAMCVGEVLHHADSGARFQCVDRVRDAKGLMHIFANDAQPVR